MKKIVSLGFILLILTSIMTLPTQAVNVSSETEVIQTEFGNIEIETETVVYDFVSRSSGKQADRTTTIKYDGKTIAEVTLSVTFG